MTGEKKIKAAIVGYGAIGPIHARALSLTDGVQFAAVCDTDTARAEKCAAEYGAG